MSLTLSETTSRSPVSFFSTAIGVGYSHMFIVCAVGKLLSLHRSGRGRVEAMSGEDAGLDSASFYVMYCLTTDFEGNALPVRAADACLILYVVASLVLRSLLRLTREALSDLSDLYAVTPFRASAHVVSVSVLSSIFCASANLVWIISGISGDTADNMLDLKDILYDEDSLHVWSMTLAATNVMTCCRAASTQY